MPLYPWVGSEPIEVHQTPISGAKEWKILVIQGADINARRWGPGDGMAWRIHSILAYVTCDATAITRNFELRILGHGFRSAATTSAFVAIMPAGSQMTANTFNVLSWARGQGDSVMTGGPATFRECHAWPDIDLYDDCGLGAAIWNPGVADNYSLNVLYEEYAVTR